MRKKKVLFSNFEYIVLLPRAGHNKTIVAFCLNAKPLRNTERGFRSGERECSAREGRVLLGVVQTHSWGCTAPRWPQTVK